MHSFPLRSSWASLSPEVGCGGCAIGGNLSQWQWEGSRLFFLLCEDDDECPTLLLNNQIPFAKFISDSAITVFMHGVADDFAMMRIILPSNDDSITSVMEITI